MTISLTMYYIILEKKLHNHLGKDFPKPEGTEI
ncbi:hypothetical protein C8C84_2849 [Flavobacterium sp. 102]|nr:hypothetical protein C8C84_2849 [Flavobacterium sp. 102]